MRRALLSVLLIGCTNWDSVKSDYCTHHPGLGNCATGGGTGGAGGNGGGAGGGTMECVYDGGGVQADWARLIGGTSDDLVTGFAADTAGTELALSGTFINRIDLGNGVPLSSNSSTQPGTFAARLQPGDGGLVAGFVWRCGGNTFAAEPPNYAPLVYTDAGLMMGSSCYLAPTLQVFSHTGAELFFDGGASPRAPDLFLFRLTPDPMLRWYGTPESYEPEKRTIAAAGADEPFFLTAVNAPRGAALLTVDAGVDGGSGPHLARFGVTDLEPQQVDLFDCPTNRVVEFENLAYDKPSQRVFALIRASENVGLANSCFVHIPGGISTGAAGNGNVGLHRFLFFLEGAGSTQAGPSVSHIANTTPDAGPLLLAPESNNSLYFAGTITGFVASTEFTQPTLAVWNMDVPMMQASVFHAYRAAPGSHAELDDLVVIPGVVPQVWVLGTVRGSLQDIDGGAVLSSSGDTSDGFLMRLNPTTLAPAQKLVFGNPCVSEHMVKMVVRPPWVYVAATAAPVPGKEGQPYSLGGQALGDLSSRDVLVFRMALP